MKALGLKYGGLTESGFKVLHRAIAAKFVEVARGTATAADLDAAHQALADAEAEKEAAINRVGAANAAIRDIREEIAALHAEHADVFAAESAKLAETAEADLAAMTDAYNNARASWEAAQANYDAWTADVPEMSSAPAWPLPGVAILATPCRPVDARG
ncbi:hypothetical protein FSW04_17910 [Baekduia soli]|uniref:Uncharacterized protein n=1 Tax=Baekduia soli TaxID=496014 RepID=A0A5B8U914_9ACTN|nr:hypothetical protein [Baekduia soli]QEC49268.1 hypothetical protein FSW04_17910 [Baekduia soli]